ncbi:MAG: 4-hydroxybenzoate octaprenyltransferase [Gammaproteobacteria bacterium]|nr:4-hydroxybenzoate octaprenyltransferase [Gammaproteobacteria bacterium]
MPELQTYLIQIRKSIRVWVETNGPMIRQRSMLYVELTRFDKPIGWLLLLWPTLWALWIAAEGMPGWHLFLVFVLGTILTRSAGCVMNDYADRDIDRFVERTRSRPLTSGAVTPRQALILALCLLVIASLLVLTTNTLTVYLSFVAIPLAVIYPYMKRYTYLPQFFLGLAFSWGIPMAFAAQTGSVPTLAWLLFIANLLWIVVFDTIYAMVDREYDLQIGMKSTAILFDDADRLIIGILQGMVLLVLVIVGERLELSWVYYLSLFVAGGIFVYQQFLIKDRKAEMCFRAFLNNNWFGATIFSGIALHYFIQ